MRPRHVLRLAGSGRTTLASIGILSLVLAGVLGSGGAPSAFAGTRTSRNLIVNGTFDQPVVPQPYACYQGGSTAIPGWVVGGGGVCQSNDPGWEPAPGSNQYLQLSSDTAAVTPGSVTQVVHTTARSRYLLQWEMGGNPQGPPTVKTMHVLWDNKVVDVPTFSTKGLSASGFGANSWVHMKISVTATSSKSTIEFVDTFDTGWGAWVDSVSLNLESATVNGFQTTMSSDPYSAAVRQMLTKVPGSAVVPASGVPVCTLQALAAEQVKNGAGLLIIWTIAPSSQFIKMPSTTRLAKAQVVEQYLTDLLTRSRSLYLAALQADRVPLQGNADFASWWGVRVESRSTTGLLMNFQIAKAGKASTITWSNVVGVTSTSASAAPEALANLLYYTKKLAVLPGSTSTT